jgi:hypothetical protein
MTAAQDAVISDRSERFGAVAYVDDSEMDGVGWITGAAINADYTSAAIDCRGRSKLTITLVGSPTSDPIADVYIQCSGDGTNWGNKVLVAAEFTTTDASAITISTTVKFVVNDPAAAWALTYWTTSLPPWMRFFYDRTSGGSATGLAASYVLE